MRFVLSLVSAIVALCLGSLAAHAEPPAQTLQMQSPCSPGAVTVSLSSRAPCPLSAAEERSLKPKDVFRECDKCAEMVVVPAGSFMMGSPADEKDRGTDEGPQHRVTIGRPFAVGKFAVTLDQFAAFVKATGYDTGSSCWRIPGDNDKGFSWKNPGFAQEGTHPVMCLKWNDAKAYVAWISRETGKDYRLLSEAEREYVTRAGTTTPFWWGSDITPQRANYDLHIYNGSAAGGVRRATVPVDSFEANPFGLYQVHGNVEDWVEDCYHDSYQGAPTDGSAWTTGACRDHVLRGGSWFDDPWLLRAAARARQGTGSSFNTYGFRLARTLTPGSDAVDEHPKSPAE